MLGGGQVLWVVGGALAGPGMVAALSLSDSDLVTDRAGPPDAEGGPDEPSDETTLPADGAELMTRGYEVGDCVMWDPTEAVAVTDLVDCTEPHRIQISGSVAAPDQDDYPTFAEWTTIIDQTCSASATALVGAPLDPDGRLHIEAIHPQPDGWFEGDRVVWCGVGTWGETVDPASLLHEDARGADQAYHFEAGQCVAYPP
ncbi:MAG TPA: septum formation family protein, partial [Acidimicrobiales bacterium]